MADKDGCEYGRSTRLLIERLATRDDLHDMAMRLESVIVERRAKSEAMKTWGLIIGALAGIIGLATWAVRDMSVFPATAAPAYHYERVDAGASDAH